MCVCHNYAISLQKAMWDEPKRPLDESNPWYLECSQLWSLGDPWLNCKILRTGPVQKPPKKNHRLCHRYLDPSPLPHEAFTGMALHELRTYADFQALSCEAVTMTRCAPVCFCWFRGDFIDFIIISRGSNDLRTLFSGMKHFFRGDSVIILLVLN